ncbi:molybdopterin-containing oxidoreductase family protein [Novosphingobium malaysiense]|uniref:molybdopterin-containing oxidoreductase family protein n=1 Tax=Novosphingobium malaysiense TaxID=1348853 RepID=UPI00068EF852|nr:molybdopterin-dependent oxidoreductase [Novosphingobium malaysiense]
MSGERLNGRLAFGGNVKRTLCGLCPANCGMLVEVEDGRPVRFHGDPDNPVNAGRLCPKGSAVIELYEHPDRLNHVLKRVGARGEGKWEKIGWEQAMDEIADKLADIREREGPEALATLGGTQHARDWATWRFVTEWGTPNFINSGRNCGSGSMITECAMYGWDTVTASFTPGVTKCLIMWGANYAESNPMGWGHLRKAVQSGEMKLIVIDPRRTKSADIATLHLAPRPRTDGALALGMIRAIIEEGLHDKDFVENWCTGFDEVREIAREWTPERTSEITGVPAEAIVEAARLYATSAPARLSFGVSTSQIGEGAARSALLCQAILRAITGNLDLPGGETLQDEPYENLAYWDLIDFTRLIDHPRRTRDNVNARDVPISSVGGYAAFRKAMAAVQPNGHYAAQYMLFTSQPHLYRAVLEGDPYPVRAIIVQNGEPLVNYGGSRLAQQAFSSEELELLVVMDHWLTPTAQLADYVLPATGSLERPELSMRWGFTRMFSTGQQVVDPLFERRDDYDLWSGLGRRLLDPAQWPEKVEDMLDRFLAPSGKSFREWADEGASTYLPQDRQFRKYRKHGFATASGKVELIPSLLADLGIDPRPTYTGPPYARSDVDDEAAYPLQMLTGSRVLEFMGSTMRQARKMKARHPEPLVELHPETAAEHGIADGDWVEIARPEGAIRQRASVTDAIRPGTVNLAGYWWDPDRRPDRDLSGVWEANANAITPYDTDLSSFAGDQPLRGLRCSIRRVNEPVGIGQSA